MDNNNRITVDQIRNKVKAIDLAMCIDRNLQPGDKLMMLYHYAPNMSVWGCKFTPEMLYGETLTVKSIVHDYGFGKKGYRGKRFTVEEDPNLQVYNIAMMNDQFTLENNPRIREAVIQEFNLN